jgi:L-gulonolactone oxidase
LVRFYEMEYGVPAARGPEAIRAIRDIVRKQNIKVHFPIEYRYVKGDDILISPAHGAETCFISVHMYKGMPYEPYFRPLEEMFQAMGGRPHWGKMHTAGPAYLGKHYPAFDRWRAIREELDPQGVFLNPYLRKLFGV